MRHESAFTIVEVIVVMAIILVLAGLILGTSGYVHKKAASSRAQAEIQAMSAGLESYKADNGIYPSNGATDVLDAKMKVDPATYQTASTALYQQLTGDTTDDGVPDNGAKSYITFKSNQLSSLTPYYVQDPFGYSYGYSTAGQAASNGGTTQTVGYNPTFDLWSTAGSSDTAGQTGWIKNW